MMYKSDCPIPIKSGERIPIIIKKLGTMWKKFPTLRLGQLLVYLSADIKTDIFFIEDSEWEKQLDKQLDKINGKKKA